MGGPKETSQPNQYVIPTANLPEGGDIHETFKVDRYGNTYDEHTTIQRPGNLKNINESWQQDK